MKKKLSLILLAVAALLVALAAGPVFGAGSVGGGAKELHGLHEAPDIPVGSISSRGDYPDHPVAAPARPDPPKRKEVRGLRETPNIPVRSIPLRRAYPDHPTGPPGGEGDGCDKAVDLTGTISGVVNVAAQNNSTQRRFPCTVTGGVRASIW